jgi:hypothetical protein
MKKINGLPVKSGSSIVLILVLLLTQTIQAQVGEEVKSKSIYERLEFEMQEIPDPVIPDYTVNIKDYGTVSGG